MQQVEDKTSEFSKGGGGKYRKDKEDKNLKVCNAITIRSCCKELIAVRG